MQRAEPTTAQDSDPDAEFLDAAVTLAVRNVADGGGPFGALVVSDGHVIAEGVNRVTRDNDPTAHAEVVAIRRACQQAGTYRLSGMTLYASCEPCPMCLAACLWARLDRVVYAADRHDAAGGGFSDLEFYELFTGNRDDSPTQVVSLALPRRTEPFEAWHTNTGRVAY
ncbi:nucleoside deaminase [Motilibacter deserti]|uniref:Nucleoside deaminase n=1 Tax=Motilibacter deserti TaxID=2714956 RepID=A0ABX0H193_9ACTN|nr:nucleoside deaminase [Motilibacter deserti]NHC15735.1 nucleoside deaminase [Motilibacter deserti]